MSYSAIMRYSGVRSRTSVAKSLRQLARLHAIELHRGSRVGLVREVSAYRVTLEDQNFLARCNEVFQETRGEIAQEREYRAELRQARQRSNPRQASTQQFCTNQSLSLSPFDGLASNKPVHSVDQEIRVLADLTLEGRLTGQKAEAQGATINAQGAGAN